MPFLRATRAHPFLVGIVVILAVVIGIVLVESRSATYKATSQILVTPVSSTDSSFTGLPVVNDSETDPTRNLQTAASILESRSAASAAAREMGRGWTEQKVARALSVLPQGESDVVTVTASYGQAATAAKLANTYVSATLGAHRATLASAAQKRITQLQAQRGALPSSDTSDAATITQEISTLRSVTAGQDPNFSLLQSAGVPTAAAATSGKLIVILALLAGLVVGIGAATVLEHLNRRVRDEDEILSLYPLPVLSRVPELPHRTSLPTTPELVPPGLREAYRTLQVQLPPRQDGAARTIMVTSPTMADGKTSSAANLALMLTAAGFQVVLLDFDLRKPDLAGHVGTHTDVMEYFRSNTPLSELLVPAPDQPRLRVVSSDARGDVTPLLEAVSRRLPEMLRDLRESADYIIIDTAPLGQVSDALRIAPLVDDVILISRVGNTDRMDLRRSRELLERLGHVPTGLVILEDVPGDPEYGYGNPPPSARRRSVLTAPGRRQHDTEAAAPNGADADEADAPDEPVTPRPSRRRN